MIFPLEIWQPRYSRKDCPVLASKIKIGDDVQYRIWFSDDPKYKGKSYIMTGKQIRDNGTLERTKQGNKLVYAIPLDVLERFKQ